MPTKNANIELSFDALFFSHSKSTSSHIGVSGTVFHVGG